MTLSSETIIELSKTKVILLTLGAVAFVALGTWILTLDAEVIDNVGKFNNPKVVYGIGIASIVFFSLCGIIGISKLFDKSPGLVLSSKGLLDNSSWLSAGLVPWFEVVEIGEYIIQNQKFVSIHVKNPERYVDSNNILIRMANRANMKMCGTPINISANGLKISHEDLFSVIQEYFQNSRSKV